MTEPLAIENKDALILGGGSILGAVEAGQIKAVLESDYNPKIVAGISVGSCNGGYIVNAKADHAWDVIGQMLWDFWTDNIRHPNDVAIRRKAIPLAWAILRKKFNGLTDTTPIDNLIHNTLSLKKMRESGVNLSVGAINLNDGSITYAEPYMPNFKDYILASKAIPVLMPARKIGFQTFIDGGLVDSAPIGTAIRKNATRIIVCTPHPKNIGASEIDSGDILDYVDQLIRIVQNNTLNNDIKIAELINLLCPADGSPKPDEPFKGKRRVPITIIRPALPVTVKLSSFTSKDVSNMLETGYATAKEILDSA